MMRSSHRVFFAIELSPQIKTRLMAYQENLKPYYPTAIDPENFHITISFLGKLSNRKVENVIDHLPKLELACFEIEIVDPIYLAKAKILAMAIEDQANSLANLKEHLESQLKKIEHFDLEKRRFLPHISLFREVESSLEKLPTFKLKMPVESLSLYESVQSSKGVRYHVIEQWPFKQSLSIKQQLLGQLS